MSYHYPDSWNSDDTSGQTGILDHLIAPTGEAKGFATSTSYKVILDDIRKLILKVESPVDGNNALGPKLNPIVIDTVKGLNRGLGEQQIMISTFSSMCDSILTQPSMIDTVAIDSFKVFKDTVINGTLGNPDTVLLETIFPKEMQKLFHLIYMLESILSSHDSELFFELLTLKNLGGKSALGTGTIKSGNRKSPMDYMRDPPYTKKFIEKHPYYYLKGKGRYENIMKSQKVAPFHLNNTDYFELTAAQGATGLERGGEPPMSFNSSQEYVTVYPRGSASAYRTTSTAVEPKGWYFMEDFGAKDCVIYMNTPEGYPPGFYSDVVVWKDEATKDLYRNEVIEIIMLELAGSGKDSAYPASNLDQPASFIHPEDRAKHKKYFDEKFVEITLDYATSTTYTTDSGRSFPFPFFDGTLFYDAWPQYLNSWKFGGYYLVETTHSFNEKSKIYEYFGNSHLYDEAKAEDNTFFRQGATRRFINSFHKCDKAKAVRAMQELIVDHIILREDAFAKTIPGFGFDQIETIVINWINKYFFTRTSSNYILRDLYESKVLKQITLLLN